MGFARKFLKLYIDNASQPTLIVGITLHKSIVFFHRVPATEHHRDRGLSTFSFSLFFFSFSDETISSVSILQPLCVYPSIPVCAILGSCRSLLLIKLLGITQVGYIMCSSPGNLTLEIWMLYLVLEN